MGYAHSINREGVTMKKLSVNQAEYKKQIKRIRTNLSKLRKQGYDVSALANKYTPQHPKRITSKLLQELKSITPKKLLREAKAQGFYGYTAPKGTKLNAPVSTYTEPIPIKKSGTRIVPEKSFGTFMEAPPQVEPFAEFMEEPTEEVQTETIEEVPIEANDESPLYDLDKGEAYTYNNDGTVDISPLYIEEDDITDTISYINGDTGEVLNTLPRTVTSSPDLSNMAIEFLRDIANGFSSQLSTNFNNAINQMIADRGEQAVADAFTQSLNNHPNMMERLSNVKEKYKAARELFGEIIEILDVPIKVKDLMRNEITRDSMADIEDYL